MRRFRFALQRVLGLREHQERAARLEMARELAGLTALEHRRDQVEANLSTCGEQGDGTQLAVLARALENGLGRARRRLDAEVEVAAQRVEQATSVFHERRRGVRTIEKLREKAVESHVKETQAEEQREFDEMARLRFLLKSQPQGERGS